MKGRGMYTILYADFIATQQHCPSLKHFRGKNHFRGYSYSHSWIQSNCNKYLYLPTFKIICLPFKLTVEVGHCFKTAKIKHCLWGSVFCFPCLMSFLVRSENINWFEKQFCHFPLPLFVCFISIYTKCAWAVETTFKSWRVMEAWNHIRKTVFRCVGHNTLCLTVVGKWSAF